MSVVPEKASRGPWIPLEYKIQVTELADENARNQIFTVEPSLQPRILSSSSLLKEKQSPQCLTDLLQHLQGPPTPYHQFPQV